MRLIHLECEKIYLNRLDYQLRTERNRIYAKKNSKIIREKISLKRNFK